MPIYCYECRACGEKFEIKHSMSFEEQTCIICKSKNIFKIPSLAIKKTTYNTKKAGKIVDQYLEDAKSEVKEEKERLRSREL